MLGDTLLINMFVFPLQYGRTPLQEAVRRKKSEVVWVFVKKYKVDISQYDEVR